MMKKDIENKEDIEKLVTLFYQSLTSQPEMKPFFADLDWEHHLPRMIGFWDFILFSTPGAYTGSMMEPHFRVHAEMSMQSAHFQTWIALFKNTVDELYEGPKAEDAKNSAQTIGATLKYKILGRDNQTGNGLTITKLD